MYESWATGNVVGEEEIGGLIGIATPTADGDGPLVQDAYASGNVADEVKIGGLVGSSFALVLKRSYASGRVTATGGSGALIGATSQQLQAESLRWNTATSGQSRAIAAYTPDPLQIIGLTDSQMKDPASFGGWDFTNVWGMERGKEYPRLGKPGAPSAGAGAAVTDISGLWAEAAIVQLLNAGVVHGVGNNRFDPEGTVTRAQFAKMLVLGLGIDMPPNPQISFADGPTIPDWARGPVAVASAHGIILGYDDNRFGPNDPITREQMAAMVTRAARPQPTGLAGGPGWSGGRDRPSSPDAADAPPWAQPSMQAAIEQGLLLRRAGEWLLPRAYATRAEAAWAIARMRALRGR